MSFTQQDVETINNSLKAVGGDLKKFAAQTSDKIDAFGARLQSVEQHVGGMEHLPGPGAGYGGPSVGSRVLEEINSGNSAFDHLVGGNVGSATFKLSTSIKAAITNTPPGGGSDNYMPSDPMRSGVQGEVLRPLTLLEALPSRPTNRDSVEFVQMQPTGAAGEQLEEGGEKATASFDGALRRSEIATVALWTAASKQVLADHIALQGEVDRVLRGKCRQKLESLIVNGGQGTDANSRIVGLLEQSTAFVPVVGGNQVDVIGEAISAMRTNGYSPDVIVMHPRDWHAISILKSEGEEKHYQLGLPTQPIPPSLWGLPVVTTPALAQGEALVIDRSFTTVLDREQAGVQVSNSHEDFFVRNLVAVRGELRAGLEVRDLAAVYRVDLEGASSE